MSKITVSASRPFTARAISWALPVPMNVALLGVSSFWYVSPTTSRPAADASRAISSSESWMSYPFGSSSPFTAAPTR